ncbi:helix-hairpin-helix domain-containing protein [Pseudonocardia sp. WMMC193]|uniref:helix-hairpin-helix domain-containing protein n=1 Tax=Pseudonocardia sp. WMMC193 TaxID=2911965 RepID=UPI001F18A9BA|nr:helix-hairpin-helix domain-containing protein [Pseudonocardia sp. WMMC193]MCF7547760.1 helix-hairpin-helix domain-containing protein [Pseudonocardia sp. WMMC193]
MARRPPRDDSAARLSALLGTPVGRVATAAPVPRAPLPASLRPAFANPTAFGAEQDTLPLRLDAVLAAHPTDPRADLARRVGEAAPRVLGTPDWNVRGAGAAGPGAAGPDAAGPDEPGADDPGRFEAGWGEPRRDRVGWGGAGRHGSDGSEWGEPPPGGGGSGGSAHVPGGRPSWAGRVAQRWVPAGWRGARLDPGRLGAAALVLVAAAAAVVAAVGVWSGRPQPEPMPALPAVSLADPTPSTAPEAAVPAELVVSVSGKVARPGLLRLPDGSRVADAVEAAGGALPGTDLSTLNLARRLADGEQVAVGVAPAPEDAGSTGPSATGAAGAAGVGGKVDLNRATLEQLDALPGVGPVTAQRILDWRAAHGRFARVDQLREVDGIGEGRFGKLKDLVTV